MSFCNKIRHQGGKFIDLRTLEVEEFADNFFVQIQDLTLRFQHTSNQYNNLIFDN